MPLGPVSTRWETIAVPAAAASGSALATDTRVNSTETAGVALAARRRRNNKVRAALSFFDELATSPGVGTARAGPRPAPRAVAVDLGDHDPGRRNPTT